MCDRQCALVQVHIAAEGRQALEELLYLVMLSLAPQQYLTLRITAVGMG